MRSPSQQKNEKTNLGLIILKLNSIPFFNFVSRNLANECIIIEEKVRFAEEKCGDLKKSLGVGKHYKVFRNTSIVEVNL